MYIGDCIDGIMLAHKKAQDKVNIYNLGWEEYINVKTVADIITDELGLADVEYAYTGGSRGWVGDSPLVHLSIEKLKKLGWQPQVSCEEGIRRTVRWLKENR